MPKGPRFYQSPEEVTRQRALEALVKASACVSIHELPEAIFWTLVGLMRLVKLSNDNTMDKVVRIIRSQTTEGDPS